MCVSQTSILSWNSISDETRARDMNLIWNTMRPWEEYSDRFLHCLTGLPINVVTRARNMLAKKGMIIMSGKKVDPDTGRLVQQWIKKLKR